MNIISMMIFILIMGAVNLKINRIEVELNFFILPVFLGILFGIINTYLSVKRTRDLEEKIREKTKEFEHYATMDDMTNTYNRRMGLKMLKNYFILSKRHKNNLSVCYVDIDELKCVNDSFGHVEGDELIRNISEMLRSSVRKSDIVSRMGGDEFLIIFPECGIEGAEKVMRRLGEKMRVYNEVSQKYYRASVSFGISGFSSCDARTLEDLLVEADNRMYAMKKENKGKVFLLKTGGINNNVENPKFRVKKDTVFLKSHENKQKFVQRMS
ncbi:GGDEF domain-containing protein [Psychrilyobacter sp. BL5]|nr:GGDEF domain-containing protein [Psychrilyobacter sp. S5]NDI78884.1 GGDEF domain-containing protein [Psychrilyobacter piezotolerans]